MIRPAKLSEITDILALTSACTEAMVAKGIYQWNQYYPSKAIFESDLEKNQLYVFELDKILIGIIVLSVWMDEEYKAVKWLTPNTNDLYVHRLAVHPTYHGQGYAQKLMDFAEDFAKENKYSSIRLDTFSQNTRNQKVL